MAMDAFSIATVTGFSLQKIDYSLAFKMSTIFGVFHIIMPYIGWNAGSTVIDMISEYDHWVAFILLFIVGGRMIIESFKEEESLEHLENFSMMNLVFLAFAVSIDSLAVGFSFSLERVNILLPAIVMGIGTLLFTFLGVYLGHQMGDKIGKNAQVMGGLILIGIGLRILLEHL